MAYSRNILELHLSSVKLDKSMPFRRSGERGILVSLVTPRPMIAERSHQRVLNFKAGVGRPSGKAYHDTIVFKETVQGPFGLRIALAEHPDSVSLEAWLRDLGDFALRSAGAYVSADFPTFLRTFSNRPFRLAGDTLNPSRSDTDYIGTGGLSFNDSDERSFYSFAVPLTSPVKRVLPTTAKGPRPASRGAARRAPIRSSQSISAGAEIGLVEFRARIL